MRVVALAADEGPCGFYRIIAPGEALISRGADLRIERKKNNILALKSSATGEVRQIQGLDDVDVVVIQRPFSRTKAEMVRVLQDKGVAVVVEIDDHVGAIDQGNIAFRATDPRSNPDNNFHHVARACEQADLVTVTTPALARVYGGHGRVAILPNAIPAAWTQLPRPQRDGNVVGWPGTVATHPHDLQATKGAVGRAVREMGWRFRAVGDGHLVERHLKLDQVAFEATGTLEYIRYPIEVGRLDLGIVPLDPVPFNQSKSWLKGMEMAALGVPFVATATADYKALARLGAGVVVETPSDWRRTLMRLMGSEQARVDLAGAGLEVAKDNTIEGKAHLWWEAWERAWLTRRTW